MKQQKHAEDTTVELVRVVIETPRGSRNKYKFEESSGSLKLSKVMPEGMVFPFDFGFVPETCADDGDPLDVLVLSDEPTFPGCEIDCRLIGILLARQKNPGRPESRNDRVVAVADCAIQYASVHELAQVEERVIKQVEEFFVNYQRVRGVEVHPLGRGDAAAALKALDTARKQAA